MVKTRVAVNGYGTIGKRVADAISKQKDMEVVGVAKTKPDFGATLSTKKGFRLFTVTDEFYRAFQRAGLQVSGVIGDLLNECDVVVDCTPGGVGAKNKAVYEKAGVKAIFQGGEKHELVEASFVAEANYAEALEKRFVRVVSCNTTGLSRTIGYLNKSFGARKVRATIVRRAADPGETKKGPINALMPDPARIPSHHGPDVQTIIRDVPVVTAAMVASTTLMHLHLVNVELRSKPSRDDVIECFSQSKRIRLVEAESGLDSTAALLEFARDLGRERGDMPEVAVWRDSVAVMDNEVYYMQAIHQESIVVPENVDAIRAVSGSEREAARSIAVTNESLGLV
jgi:glyceraldehyde-3-phosphate dehydrogenase (NAD(P))